MVRFFDKTAISTISNDDIIPITDVSDSNNDKKISISQLTNHLSSNLPDFAQVDLSNTNMLTDAILSAPNGIIQAGSGNGTIIVKNGLEILFADGRNTNGSLKTLPYTLEADVSQSITTLSNGDYYVFLTSSGTIFVSKVEDVYVSRTTPTVTSANSYWFDILNNTWKKTTNTGSSWSAITIFNLGQISIQSNLISLVVPNSVASIPNSEALLLKDIENINIKGINNIKKYAETDDKADKICQNYVTLSNGTINLQDNCSVYYKSVSSATTFTFNTSNLTKFDTNHFCTFELIIIMTANTTISFSNTIAWLDGTTPTMNTAGTYFLVFRTHPNWSRWIGSLQGKV